MKTTEELARAVGIDPKRVQAQLKAAADWRWSLRNHGKNGWTFQKKDNFLAMARIPKWMWLHPELKDTFFADNQDQHERTKQMERFLKIYPEWGRK